LKEEHCFIPLYRILKLESELLSVVAVANLSPLQSFLVSPLGWFVSISFLPNFTAKNTYSYEGQNRNSLPFQVKILTETLNKKMVEPRRGCFSLPATDLHKTAIGGIIYVTVVSGNNLNRRILRGSPSKSSEIGEGSSGNSSSKPVQTFVEVELEQLSRRTEMKSGPNPAYQSTFNMILHDNTGTLKFNLYENNPGSVRYDSLASCEVKVN